MGAELAWGAPRWSAVAWVKPMHATPTAGLHVIYKHLLVLGDAVASGEPGRVRTRAGVPRHDAPELAGTAPSALFVLTTGRN